MTVKLSSLRVSAELDASGYVDGARQKAAADTQMIAGSKAVGAALAAEDAAIARLSPGMASLSRSYIDGYSSAAKFEQAVRQVGRALDTGMSPARGSQILDGIYKRFGQQADAAKLAAQGYVSLNPILTELNARYSTLAQTQARLGTGSSATGNNRGNAQAVTQLGFQINDVATQLASGTGLFQTLAQQGGQILQVWQQSPSVFGDTARAIGSVITPARLLGATLVGGAVAGFAAYERWQGVLRDTDRALQGTGRSAGIAAAQIISMADEVAKRQGGSAGNARGTLNALANTGRIDPRNLASIAGLQRDTAATLGIDAAEANKLLATSFADPVKGAEDLNKALGGINGTMRDYIRRLAESGREQEAQNVILDRVRDRIGKADELTGFWARSWQGLAAAASGAADAVGRALDAMTGGGRTSDQRAASAQIGVVNDLENQKRLAEDMLHRFERFPEATEKWGARLADVTRQLEQARTALAVMPASAGIIDPVIAARSRVDAFAAAQGQRRIEAGTVAGRELGAPDRQASENLERLISQYERLRQAKAAFEAEGRRGASFSGPDAEAMTQDFLAERLRERTKITRDLAVAQQAIRDQTGAANLFDKAGNIDRNKALESTLTLTQRLNQETAVQRQEMTARTAAEKEAAAIARARLDNRMAGAQAGSAEDRATREGNAALIARVQIQAQLSEASRARIQSANDNLQSIRAETAAMGGGIAAQERARTEQQLLADAKRQYQALGLSVPESEIEQFRKLAAAIGLARQEQAEQRAGRDLAFERDQFGRSGVDATIANRLRSVYGDDGYKAHMDGALAAQMRFNAELESTNGLFQGFGSTLSTELQQSKSFMDALTSATRNFTNTLLSSLMNESIRMLIGGLGQGGGGGGGLLGSIFSFFGGGGAGAPMQLLGSVNAKGNAFYGGNVIPFARGGVVSSPTMFPMAGGSMGLMGEAGAEAIMPLRRGPNGSLGVQVHDSGSRSSPAIVVNITNKSGGEVKTQSSTGSGGVNILDIVVEKVASETTNPGSPIYRAQQSMGGARPQLARR